MTKDHFLTLVIGLLLGFIGGYMIHERMAEVHPQPRVHQGAEAAAAPPRPQGGAPNAPAGGAPNAMVRELQARIQQNPSDIDAILRLANLNFDIANWSRAKDLYARFLELQPGDPNILSDLGICHRNLREFEEAVAAFDRAIEAVPDNWEARFNKAIVLGIDLSDYDRADAVIAELRGLGAQSGDQAKLDGLAQELARRRAAAG